MVNISLSFWRLGRNAIIKCMLLITLIMRQKNVENHSLPHPLLSFSLPPFKTLNNALKDQGFHTQTEVLNNKD